MPVLVPRFRPAGLLSGQVQPTMDIDELVLRPWQADDAEALSAAYADPDIQRWHVRSMTVDEARTWITGRHDRWSSETGADWAVAEAGRVVGRIALRTLNLADGNAEVAYWVVPAARRRGVASRALQRLTSWLFDDVGLHRLTLLHSVHNLGSCNVARASAFELEATLRSQLLHADGWHDMHQHVRLNERT